MKTIIKELRLGAGWTQQQLADRVHVSGRTIISIEKEQYSPSLMLAYRLARVFGVSVEELCCLEENLKREDEENEKDRRNEFSGKNPLEDSAALGIFDRHADLYGGHR